MIFSFIQITHRTSAYIVMTIVSTIDYHKKLTDHYSKKILFRKLDDS